MAQTTQNSKLIKATPQKVYEACTNANALEIWLAPGDMIARVHSFNLKEGGGYKMSLFYPESEKNMQGKTSAKEDRFTARFVELIPFKKLTEAIIFDSTDPDFSGEMIMEITFKPKEHGTEVTFLFKNIPIGIKPEDNEAGTISSLEKLAKYVE